MYPGRVSAAARANAPSVRRDGLTACCVVVPEYAQVLPRCTAQQA